MAQNTNINGVLDTGSHHVIKVSVHVQIGQHVTRSGMMEEICYVIVQNHTSVLIPHFPSTRESPSVKQQKLQILPALQGKRDRCTTNQLMGA